MKKDKEEDGWLTTMCFKLAADKNAPVSVRIIGPVLGVGMAVTEPVARLCFWLHERKEARESRNK